MLLDKLQPMPEQEMLVAFIWLDNILHTSVDVENKVCNLLQRIGEKIETDRKEITLE
jgi:ribonuclease P protein component